MRKSRTYIVDYIPTWGMMLFLVFYVLAALHYPGGSQFDTESTGFDWSQNYWCNLLGATAVNGVPNGGQTFAIIGAVILSLSLTAFFFLFANHFLQPPKTRRLLKVCGSATMALSIFLFTDLHDVVLSALSGTGLIVLWILGRGVYLSGLKLFQVWGILCLILVGMNNAVYYSGWLLFYLPMLQKLTFVAALGWLVGMNIHMSNKKRDHRR